MQKLNLQPVEIKSGQSITTDYIKAGQKAGRIAGEEALLPWLIHGGSDAYEHSGVRVIPWRGLGRLEGSPRIVIQDGK